MATILMEGQRVLLAGAFKTRRGNDADVQNPTWASSAEDIVTLSEPTAEERTAKGLSPTVQARWASAVGPVGSAQVQLMADADLGDGVREITGLLDLTVSAAEATQVLMTAGEPEDIPA